MPGAATTAKSVDPTQSRLSAAEMQNARNIEDAMNLVERYGDEYMEDMPLVGEPGSFIFSKNPAAASAGGGAEQTSSTAAAGSSRQQGLRTDAATVDAAKKAGKGSERSPSAAGTPGDLGEAKEKSKKIKAKAG